MTYYNFIKDCNLVYKCFMILRPEVSPCKVRVFRALHVALREIVKKKELKKPQTETVTVGCPLQPSIFGDFYSEIYNTHRYISMKFNWKWWKGNYFSYKIHLMTRYICLHEHKIFQYNRINFFFHLIWKFSEHLAKFFNYITYVLSCCLQFIISLDILIFFKPPSST